MNLFVFPLREILYSPNVGSEHQELRRNDVFSDEVEHVSNFSQLN
jgi:hypothetical protein